MSSVGRIVLFLLLLSFPCFAYSDGLGEGRKPKTPATQAKTKSDQHKAAAAANTPRTASPKANDIGTNESSQKCCEETNPV